MDRRAFLQGAAIVALLAAGLGTWVAAPASAAPKPIGLSSDGVTYADALPASLFAGARIVPGASVTRSFWVQNRAGTTGNLAVAIQDVAGADSVMISSLSVNAASGGTSGSTVGFASANPCASLLSGVGIPAGGVVRVDVRLSLASLNGTTSQGSMASFDLPVTLTSTDVPAPDGCGGLPPVSPPSGGPTGSPTVTPPSTAKPGLIGMTVVSGASIDTTSDADDSDDPLAGVDASGYVTALDTIPNTGRFWQELDVIAWLGAMLLGGIVAWWRRRGDEEVDA